MYPGNHTDSEMLNVPRKLKAGPDSTPTHLAYITDDEADLLEIYKPDTPHKGPERIPNYDDVDWNTGQSWTSEQLDYGTSGGSTLGGPGNVNQNDPPSTMITDFGSGRPDTYQTPQEVYGDIGGASDLAGQIYASGIDTNALAWAQSHDSIPPELAAQMGLAVRGNDGLWYNPGGGRYIPGAHSLSDDQWTALRDYSTMREEGVYGGVSGNEAVVNATKNDILEVQREWKNARTQQERDMLKKKYNDALKALDSWGIGHTFDPSTGKFKEGLGPDAYTGSFADWTFSDIESDPALYDKYLNIGNLSYTDPHSGFMSPGGSRRSGYGGSGGGGGWGGGRGGGGGGGRGGGMGGGTPRFQGDFAGENPWGQSQIQRAWINQLRGMNRGGIVSLC